MSRESKLKEQINNLRGLLVAMFSLFLLFLTGRVEEKFEVIALFTIVTITIYAYTKMNKKLDELEKE